MEGSNNESILLHVQPNLLPKFIYNHLAGLENYMSYIETESKYKGSTNGDDRSRGKTGSRKPKCFAQGTKQGAGSLIALLQPELINDIQIYKINKL